MRYPQVVILEADDWIARQVRELAAENRWLLKQPRQIDHALSLARESRPTVLLVQFEPLADQPGPLALIADTHRLAPDVPAVAVSDVKLPDAERAAWTASLLDLGARHVLFPPFAKPVLEDVVSGLMAAVIARAAPPIGSSEVVIDLADEGPHG